MVNRTGYTGEEGVELLAMADEAGELWDAILARGVTRPGSARATACASRSAIRSTGTTSPGDRRDLRRARLGLRARHRLHGRRARCARSRRGAPSSGSPPS